MNANNDALKANFAQDFDPKGPDLTPTPPRPDEDPYRGKTFLEVMHIPQPKNEQQLLQYGRLSGGMRFSAKH